MNESLNILVTDSRMPWAIDTIRKFGERGHRVTAADTFKTAPGLHSKYAAEHVKIPSPVYDTAAWATELERLIADRQIDLVVPAFESVFFLSRHHADLEPPADVYVAPFEGLAQLHSKSEFEKLTTKLGFQIPETITATNSRELQDAIDRWPRYMARASYSRGGLDLLTNAGPRAGVMTVDDADPSPQNPWVVQEFIIGEDLCSYSLVHHGKVYAHLTYDHPKELHGSSGIVFTTIDEAGTLPIVEGYVDATDYTGQISFDFLRNDDGLWMVECNPRGTDGAVLMPKDTLVDGFLGLDPDAETQVVPAGETSEIDMALVIDMIDDWKDIPSDIHDLVSREGVYWKGGDVAPFLYQFLTFGHILSYKKRHKADKHDKSVIMESNFDDISWDGAPIE